MSDVKPIKVKNKKFLFAAVIAALIGLSCLVASFVHEDKSAELDNLTFVEGQVDYSYSPWIYNYRYWSFRRRRKLHRKQLDLFLEDDMVRYTAGEHVISNLYEEPFYHLVNDYPRPNARLGVLDSDDPYVKEVYSIQIGEHHLVNTEGIKDDMAKSKLILLITGIICSVLGVGLFLLHQKKG